MILFKGMTYDIITLVVNSDKRSENMNQDMKRLVELTQQAEEISKELKELKARLKVEMEQQGVDFWTEGGRQITLTESTRHTVKKDDLLIFLKQHELNYCIDSKVEPNLEMVQVAVSNGAISQADYETYVKTSVSKNIKVK